MLRKKVSLSAAQVDSAGTSPVKIMDGVAGYVIVPRIAVMQKPAGAAFNLGASSFPQLKYDNTAKTAVVSIGSVGTLDQTDEATTISTLSFLLNLLADESAAEVGGKGLLFGTNGNGDYTVGSPVTLVLWYELVPISAALLAVFPFDSLP